MAVEFIVNRFNMLCIILFVLLNDVVAQNFNIYENKWHLFGANEDINPSVFNNTCVDIVWNYDTVSEEWYLHVANGENYSTALKFNPITTLNNGAGFWVHGNSNCEVSTFVVSGNSQWDVSKFENNTYE